MKRWNDFTSQWIWPISRIGKMILVSSWPPVNPTLLSNNRSGLRIPEVMSKDGTPPCEKLPGHDLGHGHGSSVQQRFCDVYGVAHLPAGCHRAQVRTWALKIDMLEAPRITDAERSQGTFSTSVHCYSSKTSVGLKLWILQKIGPHRFGCLEIWLSGHLGALSAKPGPLGGPRLCTPTGTILTLESCLSRL